MKRNSKWTPNVGQSYYFITFDSDEFEFQCDEENIRDIIENYRKN